MKIREEVQTVPIEINVQSAEVSQEEQIFYTNDDDETKEQYWASKEAIRKNHTTEEPAVTIQTLSTNLVKQQHESQVRLRKTNQINIEQSKDAVSQQMKAKLFHEKLRKRTATGCSIQALWKQLRTTCSQGRYPDQAILRRTRECEISSDPSPATLTTELFQSLHGTAHKQPGISKMLQEIRQRYYYPSMAKYVKKWEEACEQCAKDKRVPNATITPELPNLPERDLVPEDAVQIDLLPNHPPSGGYENVLTAIDDFSRYLFAYPLTDASAINVHYDTHPGNELAGSC